jgi:hypothetical protein
MEIIKLFTLSANSFHFFITETLRNFYRSNGKIFYNIFFHIFIKNTAKNFKSSFTIHIHIYIEEILPNEKFSPELPLNVATFYQERMELKNTDIIPKINQ